MLEGACETAVAPPVDGRPRFFRADTKCCTFHPRLPNHLVGAILSDETPGAPRGAGASRPASRRASARRPSGSTRRARSRSSTTARAALLELAPELLDREPGIAPRAARPIGPEDVDGAPPPAAEYAASWGAWAGREAELYRACHTFARGLSRADLDALLGLDGRIARRAVARALEAVRSTALPPVLRLDPGATVAWLPDGSVALGAYSELEALALPGEAYALLARFTGEAPVAAVRARLRAERHADLSDDVLLSLWRQRVLVPPPGREG